MIKHEYDCFENLKKTVHEHTAVSYTPYPKKNNVRVCISQDEPGSTWSVLMKGFYPQINGLTTDEVLDLVEQTLVNTATSPLFGGEFFPRIAIV